MNDYAMAASRQSINPAEREMALQDPVAVYTAATNVEAHVIARMLEESGVEASAVEDASGVSLWAFGTLSYHKPQIWVSRADQERARQLLADYERDHAERRRESLDGDPISVTCEECGKVTFFLPKDKGTVQECSHCHAYVDVGDDLEFDDWQDSGAEG